MHAIVDRTRLALACAICALTALAPLGAAAQEARASKWVNLRAGPARDYPLVARLAPGTALTVHGCSSGFSWCDVEDSGSARGWIYAANIAYPYRNADVPVLGYGALIGLPLITFAIGSYWGDHYRDRSWYGNQSRWRNLPPPSRTSPRPPGWQGQGPTFPPRAQPPGDHRPTMPRPGLPAGQRPPQTVPPQPARPPQAQRPAERARIPERPAQQERSGVRPDANRGNPNR